MNKQLENEVKIYFTQNHKIMLIKLELEDLNNMLKKIEDDISNIELILDKKSKNTTNVQENYEIKKVKKISLEKSMQKLEIKKNNIKSRIEYLEEKMFDIELETKSMKLLLNKLDKECYDILKFIYFDRKTLFQVGTMLNQTESNISKKRQHIINDLEQWIY